MAADSAYRWLSGLAPLTLIEVEWDDAAATIGDLTDGQEVPHVRKHTCGYLHRVTEADLEIVWSVWIDLPGPPREDGHNIPLGCLRAVTIEGKRVEFSVSVRVKRPQSASKRKTRG